MKISLPLFSSNMILIFLFFFFFDSTLDFGEGPGVEVRIVPPQQFVLIFPTASRRINEENNPNSHNKSNPSVNNFRGIKRNI